MNRARSGFRFCRLRNGHDAAQLQMRQLGDSLCQVQQFFWGNARFVAATVHIDLQTNLQRAEMFRSLCRQTFCNFQTVDAMHPGKVLGHPFCFVALDRTDAMPLERQLCQSGNLVNGFLNVILAKRQLACRMGLPHSLGWHGFRNCQQFDNIRRAARCLACKLYPLADPGQIV